MKRLVLSLAVAALAVAPVFAADINPDALFAGTRQTMQRAHYPTSASYTVWVSFVLDGKRVIRRFPTHQLFATGDLFANTFSVEDQQHPATPTGVNIGFVGLQLNGNGDDKPANPIGSPKLAVNYDFGLIPRPMRTAPPRRGAAPVATPAPVLDVNAPRIIGGTSVGRNDYTVRLIDQVAQNGTTIAHLGLTPNHDPTKLRLRELWIDTATDNPQKALVAGNFDRRPSDRIAWLITFKTIGSGIYIVKEEAQAPLDYGDDGMLEHVTIEFQDLEVSERYTPDALRNLDDVSKFDLLEPTPEPTP